MQEKSITFFKYQGIGNDFVLIDSRKESLEGIDLPKLAEKACDRNFGIGADGLIIIWPSKKADYRMQIINPDGSEPEMCGNGIRCFAKYVYENTPEKERKEMFSVETLAGIMLPAVVADNGRVAAIEVDMGEPRYTEISQELKVAGHSFQVTNVSMGNPHCVIFVEDLAAVDLANLGPQIENHPAYPQRTNVEFVKVNNQKEVTIKVWERGAGETLACGTGACATVVAGVLTKKLERKARVHLPGGDLLIEWAQDDNRVVMTGPAEFIFEGKYPAV